uniref:Uncharacterized protein n=1 Tax=Triticum urartu TaxID=4572 RepID=A0A8R7K0D0_TRIUA
DRQFVYRLQVNDYRGCVPVPFGIVGPVKTHTWIIKYCLPDSPSTRIPQVPRHRCPSKIDVGTCTTTQIRQVPRRPRRVRIRQVRCRACTTTLPRPRPVKPTL